MYVSLVCFFIVSFIFILFGKSLIFYFNKNEAKYYSLIDAFFVGLCFVGAILNVWSLFLPTDIWALAFLVSVSLILFFSRSKYFVELFKNWFNQIKSEKVFLVLILLSTFIVLLYSLVNPQLYDTYLYHINAIQWNEMYKAVPGLANFHDRFGFNSSMFVLSAGFSFSAIYNQYIFVISSLSFLVFFIWLLKQIYFTKGLVGLFSLLFLYFFIQQYAFDISSPGTDLLPNILVAFTLLSLLFENNSLEKKQLLYVVIPMFCVTLKLATFPIAIIGIIALYRNNKNLVLTVRNLFFFGIALILPWLIRNVILTGYIIYPMENLDFFNFDWEVPKQTVSETKKWIYSWARVPFRDYNEVLSMPFKEWFSIWWKASLAKNKLFFILAAIAPFIYGIASFFKKREKNYSNLFVICIAYSSFILWIFTAPDFRFSFSFILILALSPLLILKDFIKKIKTVFNPFLITFLFCSLFLISKNGYELFRKDYSSKKIREHLYLPMDIYYVKENGNIQFNSILYSTPTGNKIELFETLKKELQCFDKFPCTPNLTSGCRLRGKSLEDGFINIE
jgi:hypothetical protein